MIASALGDAVGERLFRGWSKTKGTLIYTDDTATAIGLAEAILMRGDIIEQTLGDVFRKNFFNEPLRGYSPTGDRRVFKEYQGGSYYAHAKKMGEAVFPGGSWGNGAAMRMSPFVFFLDADDTTLYDRADRQARITHTHRIAIDGAAVMAKAIVEAVRLDPVMPFDPRSFCQKLIDFARTNEFKSKLNSILDLLDVEPEGAARRLGQGMGAHESVPFAIYSFLKNPGSFNDCLFCATENAGDRDTVGAMGCAISGACRNNRN